MHTKSPIIVIIVLLAILGGCSKNASTGGQTATLALKDGTTVTGTVTKSDTSSITIQAANGVVSTYPLTQLASVNYGRASGPTTSAAPALPRRLPLNRARRKRHREPVRPLLERRLNVNINRSKHFE